MAKEMAADSWDMQSLAVALPKKPHKRRSQPDEEERDPHPTKISFELLENPIRPFLFTRTIYEVQMSTGVTLKREPRPIIYHPKEPQNYGTDIMAAIVVNTGNYHQHKDYEDAVIDQNTLPWKTEKFLCLTSTHLTACERSDVSHGVRHVSRFALPTDVPNINCTPYTKGALAEQIGVPMGAIKNGECRPAEFMQALCLPAMPFLDIEEFYISQAGGVVDEINSLKPLRAIIAIQYMTGDPAVTAYLQNCCVGYRPKDIQVIGGNFDGFATSASNDDLWACGWKIRAGPEVNVAVVGVNMAGWDGQNESASGALRRDAILNARVGEFFEGKGNGFVFIVYQQKPHIEEAILQLRVSLKTVTTLGIQIHAGPILFQGAEISMTPSNTSDFGAFGYPFARDEIKIALLMVAY